MLRWFFRHNKPCADRDFVDLDLAVAPVLVLLHLADVLFLRDCAAEALAADIAESDGKGKFLVFQCLALAADEFLAYDQLAGLDLVVENHFQLGQLVRVSLVAVRAKNQCVSFRLFGVCVLVLDGMSVKAFPNHIFRSAIVRGGALDTLQSGNIARCNNACVAVYLCNRYVVFIYRPAWLVQVGVNLLFQGYVAAAAELVIKGNDLIGLQQELSVFIHNVAVAKVGGKHRKGRVFQLTAFGRAIVGDVVLRGGKACLFRQGRRTAECKVAQVNAALIVIAHRNFCKLIVEMLIFLQGVQHQPYGVPRSRVQRGRRAVDIAALQPLGAKAAHLLAVCVPKFHIQVAQGAGIGLVALHIDIKGQVAVRTYIYGCVPCQCAAALVAV